MTRWRPAKWRQLIDQLMPLLPLPNTHYLFIPFFIYFFRDQMAPCDGGETID
jgi:hypothetical protein